MPCRETNGEFFRPNPAAQCTGKVKTNRRQSCKDNQSAPTGPTRNRRILVKLTLYPDRYPVCAATTLKLIAAALMVLDLLPDAHRVALYPCCACRLKK